MAKDYFKGKKILKSPSHFIDEANESIEEIRRNISNSDFKQQFSGYGSSVAGAFF